MCLTLSGTCSYIVLNQSAKYSSGFTDWLYSPVAYWWTEDTVPTNVYTCSYLRLRTYSTVQEFIGVEVIHTVTPAVSRAVAQM